MEIDKATLDKLTQWAEKSGKDIEDLKQQLEEKYNELIDLGKSPKVAMSQARFHVYRDVKSTRYSRAKPAVGIFFGYNQAYDLAQRDREYALEVFASNPTRAIDEKLTNADGVPLDPNPKMPWGVDNPDYGDPLQPRFIRQSIGIGRPADGSGPMKLMILTHNGDQALQVPPLGEPVEFLANLRADEELRRLYNTSVNTAYKPTTIEEFGEVTPEAVCNILMDAPEEFKSDLAGLEEWHAEHEQDYRRIVIVVGDVMYVSPEALSSGNYLIILEDESTMEYEGEGITIFVHPEIEDQIDFGAGSRIVVVGRTGMMAYYDREERKTNPDVLVPMLNALGVWAIPEYKMAPEEVYTISSDEVVEE